MDSRDEEPLGPQQKDKSLPGHDIFCTPENSNFLSKTPYKTLDPTQREIRLLKVLPDSGSGFVECDLLPSQPIAELRGKYLALSYYAGDPRNTETIFVNGVKCNVFANLCHALTCTRHFWTTQPGDRDLLLWVDQICINQADLSERSHQVGFMRDIYQSAQQTVICLSTSNTQGRGMKWLLETYKGDLKQALSESLDNQTESPSEGMLVFWKEIIESPWWSRAWVFQEFMVSAHATFLSGHHQLSWVKVRLALKHYVSPERQHSVISSLESIFRQPGSGLDDHDGGYGSEVEGVAGKVWFMLKTKAEWKDTDSLSFVLARSRNSKASDDRDRVYAFLGLTDPGYAIIPNYSAKNSLCHVLTETTRNIIKFENSLHVLSVLGVSPRERRPELPSWVVDWTSEGITGPLDTWALEEMRHTPRGGSQAIASFEETKHPETLQETTVMKVTGTFFKNIYDDHQPDSYIEYLPDSPEQYNPLQRYDFPGQYDSQQSRDSRRNRNRQASHDDEEFGFVPCPCRYAPFCSTRHDDYYRPSTGSQLYHGSLIIQDPFLGSSTETFRRCIECGNVQDLDDYEVPSSEALQVWYLGGSPYAFVLKAEWYGYRIIRWISPLSDERLRITLEDWALLATAEQNVISIF